MKIDNCCCLCIEESKNNGDDLIWKDGLQLCQECYNRYSESGYNEKIMALNAIKKYRNLIRKLGD